MSYFGNTRGMVGDPGFFDTLFRIGKGAVRGALGIPAARAASRAAEVFRPPVVGKVVPTIRAAGPVTGRATEILGGATVVGARAVEMMGPRRRRMNVGNAKALRRAIRRTDGFVRLAKSALKNTGFKIVSKSSGRVSRATMDKAVAAAHHRR